MGKKVLIAVIMFIAILSALIYFKSKQAEDTLSGKTVVPLIENSTLQKIQAVAKNKKDSVSQQIPEEKKVQIVQKAPPTFGYMTSGEKIQIVGLMSRNDQNGTLKRYIDELCRKQECSREISYRKEIEDAPWQEGVVKLFELFSSGAVEKSAIFIEAGHITVEGKLVREEAKESFSQIMQSLEKSGLQIETSRFIRTVSTEVNSSVKTATQALPVPVKEPVAHVKDNNKTIETNATIAKKTGLESAVQTVTDSEKKSVSKVHKQTSERKKRRFMQYRIEKSSLKQPPKATHQKRVTKSKKFVKRRHKKEDIIAPSYMETSVDLEHKVKSRHKVHTYRDPQKLEEVIFEEDKSPDDMVAKPKFKILK